MSFESQFFSSEPLIFSVRFNSAVVGNSGIVAGKALTYPKPDMRLPERKALTAEKAKKKAVVVKELAEMGYHLEAEIKEAKEKKKKEKKEERRRRKRRGKHGKEEEKPEPEKFTREQKEEIEKKLKRIAEIEVDKRERDDERHRITEQNNWYFYRCHFPKPSFELRYQVTMMDDQLGTVSDKTLVIITLSICFRRKEK